MICRHCCFRRARTFTCTKSYGKSTVTQWNSKRFTYILPTVTRLLEEWNEAKSIIGTYELRDVTEANCEMTDVMDHLNEMMQTVTLDHVPAVCESRLDELNLATLLSGVQCDVAGDQNRLFMSKKQKINEFQTMVCLLHWWEIRVRLIWALTTLRTFSHLYPSTSRTWWAFIEGIDIFIGAILEAAIPQDVQEDEACGVHTQAYGMY